MRSLAELQPKAKSLLDAYMDPRSDYSFTTYDVRPLNMSDALQPEDILVANLLSLRLTAKHVVPLFAATKSSEETGPGALRRALDDALVALRPTAAFESFSSAEAMQDLFFRGARAAVPSCVAAVHLRMRPVCVCGGVLKTVKFTSAMLATACRSIHR